jgi:hypothetical protein
MQKLITNIKGEDVRCEVLARRNENYSAAVITGGNNCQVKETEVVCS